MNIGIDIDGTLTQSLDIERLAKAYIKKNDLPYKLVNPKASMVIDMFDWDSEICRQFYLANCETLHVDVPAKEGASEIVSKLKQQGNKIYIITARSVAWCREPYKISEEWLKKYNIPFDELLVEQFEKSDACRQANIGCFIDDSVSVLKGLEPLSLPTILMETKYNKEDTRYNGLRVKDWRETEKLLNDLHVLEK